MCAPDNYSQWEAHEREAERWLARRPVCIECEEHIQEDSAFYINGEWICENCIEIYRRDIHEDECFEPF